MFKIGAVTVTFMVLLVCNVRVTKLCTEKITFNHSKYRGYFRGFYSNYSQQEILQNYQSFTSIESYVKGPRNEKSHFPQQEHEISLIKVKNSTRKTLITMRTTEPVERFPPEDLHCLHGMHSLCFLQFLGFLHFFFLHTSSEDPLHLTQLAHFFFGQSSSLQSYSHLHCSSQSMH